MSVYLVLLLGVIAVSFASVLIKLCDAPAMVIASYRLSLASLFFIGGAAVKKVNPVIAFNRRDLVFALLSGIFLCLHFATWITSLKYTSVASSVVLVSTAPVFVAIGSFIFLKEKISKLLFWGVMLTVVGATILSTQEFAAGTDTLFGNGLALAGALGGAGYFLVGRDLRARIDTLAYVTVVYSTSALLLILLTLLFREPLFNYDFRVYLLFFLIAFVPQVIGHTSFNWSLKHVKAATVAVVTLGEPIGATVLALLFLGEKVTAIQLIGGILILIGVAFALRGDHPQKSKS